MGVCVKGMYLPPSCYFCPMTNEGFYLCKANNPYKQLEDDCEERRPNWCPLTEVPEPHGRLIDADTMITSVKRQTDFLKSMGGDFATVAEILEKGILQEIENAPTVIPASEEGE